MRAVAYPLAQFDETTSIADTEPVAEPVVNDVVTQPTAEPTPETPVAQETPTDTSETPADTPTVAGEEVGTTSSETPAVAEATGTTTTDLFGLEPCLLEAGCKTRSLTFDNFALPEFTSGTVLDTVQLRLSLAAKAKPGSAIQRFVVSYSLDAGATYLPGTVIDVDAHHASTTNCVVRQANCDMSLIVGFLPVLVGSLRHQ